MSSSPARSESGRSGPIRKCPICSKPRSEAHTPFCSQRCRDRDLMRWLDEGYVLPGPAVDPEDAE